MKKIILIAACLLTLLLLGSCGGKTPGKPGKTEPAATVGAVTFFNGVADADVWILPDTEANRKTTAWGTATAADVKGNESREIPLCEAGDEGLYLFRMIDADKLYYSADAVALKTGWTVQITGNEVFDYTLLVTNETGALQGTYEVFSASL